MMASNILVTEVIREAATVIMLVTVAVLAVRNRISRFALFIFAFAVWDLFYYIYLALLLGWPASLLTWDLLFLIPVAWAGPVLAPVINSLTMILLAVLILHYRSGNELFTLSRFEWFLLVLGSFIVIIAYTRPYTEYLLAHYSFTEILHFRGNKSLEQYAAQFIPARFSWVLFSAGQCLFFWAITGMIRRMKRKHTLSDHNIS
jgi:hypothetical protein